MKPLRTASDHSYQARRRCWGPCACRRGGGLDGVGLHRPVALAQPMSSARTSSGIQTCTASVAGIMSLASARTVAIAARNGPRPWPARAVSADDDRGGDVLGQCNVLGRLAHSAAVGGPTSGRSPMCFCLLRCSRWCRSPTASPTPTGSSTATDPTLIVDLSRGQHHRIDASALPTPDGMPWHNHRVYSYVTPGCGAYVAAGPNPHRRKVGPLLHRGRTRTRPCQVPARRPRRAPAPHPRRQPDTPPRPPSMPRAFASSASGKTRRPRVPGDHPLTGPIGTPDAVVNHIP